MGNYCDNNFENIRDPEEVVVSQVERPSRFSNSRVSEGKASSQLTPHKPIDQEVIHSIFKKPDPVVEVVEEDSRVQFPAAEVITITSDKPQKVRPKLEELDLSFYHGLGLPDYEYQPIPQMDRQLYNGVQTYELKDNYGVKYVGEWLNNHIHGNGVLLSNTSKYIGQFKFGLKHYHGREILKNEVYQGQFQGGRRKGLGIRYTPTCTQRGYFDEEFEEGDIIYLDGRVEHKDRQKNMDLMQELNQESQIQNKSLGSLYTDKYYESSELPQEWYDQSQLQRRRQQSSYARR